MLSTALGLCSSELAPPFSPHFKLGMTKVKRLDVSVVTLQGNTGRGSVVRSNVSSVILLGIIVIPVGSNGGVAMEVLCVNCA